MSSKKRTYTNEDTTVIVQATNDALKTYSETSGPVRVSDLLQEYNGSKSALARQISGISDTGKLPSKGTAERARYDAANKNIGRWLAYESKSGKQARNPNTKDTQERLKQALEKKRPPSNMSIKITGWIGYDNDYRYRTIETTLPNNGATTEAFVQNMKNENTSEAYQDVFQAYKVGRGIITVSDDNPIISITFSE